MKKITLYIYSLFIQLFLCHGTKCVILWSIVFSRFLNEPSLNYFCRTTSGMASSWRSTICLSPTTEWRIRLMRLTAFFSRASRSLFSCLYFGILLISFGILRFICFHNFLLHVSLCFMFSILLSGVTDETKGVHVYFYLLILTNVQSVIDAVRQINTDPARTPTALAVSLG